MGPSQSFRNDDEDIGIYDPENLFKSENQQRRCELVFQEIKTVMTDGDEDRVNDEVQSILKAADVDCSGCEIVKFNEEGSS